jgi:hypothetical protein
MQLSHLGWAQNSAVIKARLYYLQQFTNSYFHSCITVELVTTQVLLLQPKQMTVCLGKSRSIYRVEVTRSSQWNDYRNSCVWCMLCGVALSHQRIRPHNNVQVWYCKFPHTVVREVACSHSIPACFVSCVKCSTGVLSPVTVDSSNSFLSSLNHWRCERAISKHWFLLSCDVLVHRGHTHCSIRVQCEQCFCTVLMINSNTVE